MKMLAALQMIHMISYQPLLIKTLHKLSQLIPINGKLNLYTFIILFSK